MNGTAYGPDLSLSADQEGLLRTALSSNPRNSPQTTRRPSSGISSDAKSMTQPNDVMANGSGLYTSPIQDPDSGRFANLDDSPLFDNYDLEDGTYEWDTNGDQLFGDIAGEDYIDDADIHDKRKASSGSDDGEIGMSKRQEGDGKTAKKPGRKPLTAEPTTKRKAQNRAAQRAFRERKERHLKDLETKVDDLEKVSEATNHENGRLRAQVEKLNMELREYRKRLSINSTAAGHSPPPAASQNRSLFAGNGNDFQFAFPKFGDLPGASFLSNGSLAKTSTASQPGQSSSANGKDPVAIRHNSSNSLNSKSPISTNASSAAPENASLSQAPTNGVNQFPNNNFGDLTGLFSPSVLETASRSNSTDYISQTGGQSANGSVNHGSFSNNNGAGQGGKGGRASSASMTNSPASSMSQTGPDSSCGTTPEPSADSPENRKASEGALNTISEESTVQDTAAWNPANLFFPTSPDSNRAPVSSNIPKSPISDFHGIDWMAQQNGGQFDPVLFGDYRDPQDNILNNTFDDFFTDAFPTQDFALPYNTGDAPNAEPKRDLMKEIEIHQSGGNDEIVPNENVKKYVGCDKLWSRVQMSEKVKSGEVDMDDLCTQLKSKAKCSGQGAVIDQEEVDRILGPEPEKDKDIFKMFV